jgi:hypothetical protein
MSRHITVVLAAGLACACGPRALAQFTEHFDSYPAGTMLAGQGGWETWCTTGPVADSPVSGDFARSAPNALRDHPASDMVHRVTVTSGRWVFRVFTYIPTGATGNSSIIVMNRYCTGGAEDHSWSIVITLNGDTEQAQTWLGASVPLVRDRWVEFRAEVDLEADSLRQFYDGQPLGGVLSWRNNVGGGVGEIAAIDLYSESMDGVYYDDVSLARACTVDFNGDGAVNIQDFLAFLQAFSVADPRADMDGNGQVNVQDFLAFLQAFAAGCP